MRHRLPRETEVKTIAARLGVSRQHVCGCLLMIWSVADQHAVGRFPPNAGPAQCPGNSGTNEGTNVPTTEGFLSAYSLRDLDHEADQPGIAQVMQEIGWLTVYEDGVAFPQWEVHHSKSAKSRASEAKKKAKQRERKGTGMETASGGVPANVPVRPGQSGGPEGEGEGDKKKTKKPEGGGGARTSGGGGAGSVTGRTGSGTATTTPREKFLGGEKEIEAGEKTVWKILEAWDEIGGVSHEHVTAGEDGLEYDPRVVQLLRSRLRDPEFAGNWERGLRYVRSSDLCCGRVEPREGFSVPWRAGLKWFLSPGKLAEVLAGKHGGRPDGLTEEDEEDVFAEIRREAERLEAQELEPQQEGAA